MIGKVLLLAGAAAVTFLVQLVAIIVTQSVHIGILVAGACAFSMGVAAGRDGIWRG